MRAVCASLRGRGRAGASVKVAGGQIELGIFAARTGRESTSRRFVRIGDVDEKEALLRLARDAVRKQVLLVLGLEERGKRDEE